MSESISDGFSMRRELSKEYDKWINRLRQTQYNNKEFNVKNIEDDEDKAMAGSLKVRNRHYTVEECLENIKRITEEDRNLALRISITNQNAVSEVQDMDGNVETLTIPELIVLKTDIIPKLRMMIENIPIQSSHNLEIIGTSDNSVLTRSIREAGRNERIYDDNGRYTDKVVIDFYNIKINEDFGWEQRKLQDEMDKIEAWERRIKQAINQANKTPLVNIE